MNYSESVRALMALGRELASPAAGPRAEVRPHQYHRCSPKLSAIRI